MLYQAYNLIIQSQLVLPELAVPDTAPTLPADVLIRLGSVPAAELEGRDPLGPFLWVNSSSLWLEVPGVARYLVRHGNEVIIEPEAGIDEDSVRVFLLGSVFGALLLQRGHFVLQGCAIQIGDQSLVCIGDVGTGKSTLAYGFAQRGYSLICDDFVAIDKECHVLPGVPRIKVWQDMAERLKVDTHKLRRVRASVDRFNLPIEQMGIQDPVPVRWVYALSTHDRDTVVLEPIHGMQRFSLLIDNTYRLRVLEGMGLKREHLKFCGQLASRIRLARVTRPVAGFMLNETVDAILNNIETNP